MKTKVLTISLLYTDDSLIHNNDLIIVMSYQLSFKLTKIRAELASLNYCAVPFLSRAPVNLCCYTSLIKGTMYIG